MKWWPGQLTGKVEVIGEVTVMACTSIYTELFKQEHAKEKLFSLSLSLSIYIYIHTYMYKICLVALVV
jgi:hypothetical protein